MKPEIRLRVEARLDIQQAYDWYEERSEGLGEMFLVAVSQCLEMVAENPRPFPRYTPT